VISQGRSATCWNKGTHSAVRIHSSIVQKQCTFKLICLHMLSWTEAYMSWSEPTMHRLHKPAHLQCFQVLWQITCQNQTTPRSQFRIDVSFKKWFSLWNPTVSLQGSKFVIWHSYDATLAGPISIRLCYGKWISNLLPTRLSSNSICAVVRSSSKDMMDLNGFDVLTNKQIGRPVSFWGPPFCLIIELGTT
jgi:hypothetical protein